MTDGRPHARGHVWFLAVLAGLAALAAVASLELDTDSYQHFQNSVEVVAHRDVRSLILDLWNKPLPTLIYGIPGLGGIWLARLASILSVLGIAACVHGVARRLWPPSQPLHPAWSLVAVLFQVAVLPQALTTMTELPAAFALSVGLWLYVSGRPTRACLAWGCLPLLRVECALMMAYALGAIAFRELWRQRGRTRAWGRVLTWGTVGSFPFTAWWALGAWLSGQADWLMLASYAHLRPWDATAIVRVNAFSGLPGSLAAPMLVLLMFGALRWRAFVAGRDQTGVGGLLLGWATVHLLFLSAFVVYPEATYGGQGIAAINGRNYNVLAPLFALLVLAGLEGWPARTILEPGRRRRTLAAASLTVLALFGFHALQRTMGVSAFGALYKLGVGLVLLLTFIGASAWVGRRRTRWVAHGATWRSGVMAFQVLAALATIPLFWYPLRSHDQRPAALRAFCDWFRETPIAPPAILQDLSGRLDRFCGIQGVDVHWVWPSDLASRLTHASAGTWLVLEIDESALPAARYPADVLALVADTSVLVPRQKRPALPVPPWEHWLNRFSERNLQVGWMVYVKR